MQHWVVDDLQGRVYSLPFQFLSIVGLYSKDTEKGKRLLMYILITNKEVYPVRNVSFFLNWIYTYLGDSKELFCYQLLPRGSKSSKQWLKSIIR